MRIISICQAIFRLRNNARVFRFVKRFLLRAVYICVCEVFILPAVQNFHDVSPAFEPARVCLHVLYMRYEPRGLSPQAPLLHLKSFLAPLRVRGLTLPAVQNFHEICG